MGAFPVLQHLATVNVAVAQHRDLPLVVGDEGIREPCELVVPDRAVSLYGTSSLMPNPPLVWILVLGGLIWDIEHLPTHVTNFFHPAQEISAGATNGRACSH
jgi:hypothetical protein